MRVLVGTASWSDKSLVQSKKFYPPDANTPEARLRHYAARFPLVEVDTSYDAMPLPQTAQAWVARTPAQFTLNIKAFRVFTGHAQVRECVEAMPGCTLSVEFRNKTWFDEAHVSSTLAFERELNVVHTVSDGPQGFANSVPPVWESTHLQYALVRLHGRNAETWNLKGAASAAERFNYDYRKEELIELAARIERLSPETFTTHVIFNNNFEDQGQRNAAA